jgi:hypothetical protein
VIGHENDNNAKKQGKRTKRSRDNMKEGHDERKKKTKGKTNKK